MRIVQIDMTRRQFLPTAAAFVLAGAKTPEAQADHNNTLQLPDVIRVGIIGFAGHYSDITGAAKLLSNIRFTAICDPSTEVLERVGRSANLGPAARFTDYREMLQAEALDIVAICGENAPRAGIIEACAARNLPIMTEKPLALTFAELAGIKQAFLRHRVPLSMLLTMRCTPPYLAMREIVQKGTIGEVVSMDGQKSYKLGTRPDWMKTRKSFGGTIPYVGIHMLDLMRWISGREFVRVAAFASNVGTPEIGDMENNAALAFKLENQGSASLRIDYLRPATAPSHGDDRLRIVGTRGIVESKDEQVTLVTSTESPRIITPLPPAKSLFVDFVESIYLGKPHIISREEIFRISAVVLTAREAADTGRVLAL